MHNIKLYIIMPKVLFTFLVGSVIIISGYVDTLLCYQFSLLSFCCLPAFNNAIKKIHNRVMINDE